MLHLGRLSRRSVSMRKAARAASRRSGVNRNLYFRRLPHTKVFCYASLKTHVPIGTALSFPWATAELSLAAAGFPGTWLLKVLARVDSFSWAPAGIHGCWHATRQVPKRPAHEKWAFLLTMCSDREFWSPFRCEAHLQGLILLGWSSKGWSKPL